MWDVMIYPCHRYLMVWCQSTISHWNPKYMPCFYHPSLYDAISHDSSPFWPLLSHSWDMISYNWWMNFDIFMPPPLGAGGIMFSGCSSVHPSVRPKPEIPSFDPYMGLLVHPTNCDRFTTCPSVCPSLRLSVCPSGEVSGHLPENAWREWLEILHADVSWPSSELNSLWPRSVNFFVILALFWLCETCQIWGFRAFPGERMEEMAWSYAPWCILTTFRPN